MVSESGTDGNGGGVAVVVLLLDPVRPALLLDAASVANLLRVTATDQPRHWWHLRSSPMALAAMATTFLRCASSPRCLMRAVDCGGQKCSRRC